MTLRSYLMAAFILAGVSAAGQDRGDYAQFIASDPYLYLSNAAFMDCFQGRIGTMSSDFRKMDGDLISLSESPDAWQGGAGTESYYRTGERLAFYGKMHWQHFQGREMGGQVLMDPEYNPVNFLESTTDTKGIKKRETYDFAGGLSLRLFPRLAAGIRVDYTSADQTKVKDPRFSNVWMDINVQGGLMLRVTDKFILGASATYRNTLEQIKGGIYGTTDRQYFIQTDKGGFYGTVAELAGDYNYISVNNSRPMENRFTGIALQVAVGKVFSSEFWGHTRNGYYGRKSSSTATFFELKGAEAGYRGKLLIPFGRSLHALCLEARAESLTNNENKFRYVTPTGQSTVVDYTGQDKVLSRSALYANASYTWYLGSGFAAGISAGTRMRSGKTTLYPFWRKTKDSYSQAEVWSRFSFPAGKLRITAQMHAFAGSGKGVPKNDGSEFEAVSTSIRSFDTYLYRQFEYDTAARAGGKVSVRCTLPSFGKFTPYVQAGDCFVSLVAAPEYLDGSSRNTATVILGCNF